MKLYEKSGPEAALLNGGDVKKSFGMVHGISMLLDLLNLLAVFAYLCLLATT